MPVTAWIDDLLEQEWRKGPPGAPTRPEAQVMAGDPGHGVERPRAIIRIEPEDVGEDAPVGGEAGAASDEDEGRIWFG